MRREHRPGTQPEMVNEEGLKDSTSEGTWAGGEEHTVSDQKRLPLEQVTTALDLGSQKPQGALRICEQEGDVAGSCLERGTDRESREAAAVNRGALSVPLTPCLVPFICHAAPCHNTDLNLQSLGFLLWPELAAWQHHKCSENSFAPEMVPYL